MFRTRSKPFIYGFLLFSVLLGVAGFVVWYRKSTACFFPGNPPIRSFVLTIDPNQQKLLVEQSQKFADRLAFRFDIVYYTPQGEQFLIDMKRNDIEIIITNTMLRLDRFDVDFYNNDCIRPPDVLDTMDLADDLESFFREIPNAEFIEKK